MSGFPKLVPAFTARIAIKPPSFIAPTLRHVLFIPDVGTLVSEPNYPIQLNATLIHGADFITTDPDGRHVRLEVQSLAKDKSTDGLIRFNYKGTVNIEDAAGAVLKGEPGAKTTPFGEAFIHPVFETGTRELAALQDKTFVGSGHFVLDEGQPVIVEYKISEVVA